MNNNEMGLVLDTLLIATPQLPAANALRIVLLPEELFSVPANKQQLRVLSGRAWVSFDGEDHAVRAGETLQLHGANHKALVSDLDDKPLVFELLSA